MTNARPHITAPPDGMPRVMPYNSTMRPLMVKSTLLKSGTAWNGAALTMESLSSGWASAGSMARWDDPCIRVAFTLDGARHGRKFAPEHKEQAKAMFNKLNVA